jgi:hypothetical protein
MPVSMFAKGTGGNLLGCQLNLIIKFMKISHCYGYYYTDNMLGIDIYY